MNCWECKNTLLKINCFDCIGHENCTCFRKIDYETKERMYERYIRQDEPYHRKHNIIIIKEVEE